MAQLPQTIADLGMTDEENIASTGQMPADIIDQMAQVREEQARSLQEHIQYRQGLEQKKQEAELRGGDLDVSERLMRVFDTTLPKPFREFEFRGLSRHLGIDPKGDNYKELSKVILGLDPDSSAAVREAFTARIADASPGQISEFARGILQGKVPVSQLAGMVKEHQRAEASQQGKVEGLFQRVERSKGEFTPNDVIRERDAQAGSSGASAGMAAGNLQDGIQGGITQRESTNVTMQQATPDLGPQQDPSTIIVEGPPPTDNRTVDPSIAAALGYDANTTPSAEILARHPGIGGLDAKGQQEKAKKLAEYRQFSQETVKLADRLIGIVDQDPNTVPYTMPIIGKWLGQNLNAAKEIVSLEDARNSFRKAVFPEGIYEYYKKNQIGRTDEETRETARKAQEVFNNMFALAYMSAKAKDPAGRLSDQDIQLELKGLGADSGSADLFKSALTAHKRVTADTYNSRVQTETGGPAVDISASKPATIQRQSSADPTAVPTGQPTGQTPAGTPATTPAEQKTEVGQTPTQQAQKSRTREQAKEADEEVQQQRRKFELEQAPIEAKLRLEAAQRDVVRLQLAMDAAKEAKEWKEYQKLKDQKAEAQKQRDKISAAFAQFARALSRAGGGSVGGTPSMGADQDASAFKITPGAGAKRAPPAPGRAAPSHTYTYTGKRRAMEQ